MSDLRDKILNSSSGFTGLHAVPVPEWGSTVYLKGMTGKERDRTEKQFGDLEKAGRDNLRARILVKVLLDETGKRIFSDDDADQLGEQDAPILDDLFGKALMYAGMKADQREQALKNSSAGPAGATDSGLPGNTAS